MSTINNLHPAYLFLGDNNSAINYTKNFVKKTFCKKDGSDSCINCNLIEKNQHYAVRWISPESGYKLENLEIIFDTIKFSLDNNEHFFFILQKADLLSISCANSLLKPLEEPPLGYHFILLANNKELVLPTISSRCLVYNVSSNDDNIIKTDLLNFFLTGSLNSAFELNKYLERTKPSDKDAKEFIEALRIYYIKHASLSLNEKIIKKIEILDNYYKKLPMPGSGKFFIKNIFLSLLN